MGNTAGIESIYRAIDAANHEKMKLLDRMAFIDSEIAKLEKRIEKIFDGLDDVDADAIMKRHPGVPGHAKRTTAKIQEKNDAKNDGKSNDGKSKKKTKEPDPDPAVPGNASDPEPGLDQRDELEKLIDEA